MHLIPEISRELLSDRNMARDSLLRMLEPLVTNGDLLTVVFDGKDGRRSIQKHRNMDSFSVIFSSSSEGADGVIERMVMATNQPEKLCVITNDNSIRNCAYAHGCSAMRVEQFIRRLDYSIDQLRRKTSQGGSHSQGNMEPFVNRIDFPEKKEN